MANYALEFTGSQDATADEGYVAIASSDDIGSLVDDFTIATWFKCGDTRRSNYAPYNAGSWTISTADISMPGGWAIGRMAANRAPFTGVTTSCQGRITFISGDMSNWFAAYSDQDGNTGINIDGNWHHLVGIVDSGVMTLYIDGTAQAATADTSGNIFAAGSATVGRAMSNSNTYYSTGEIDQTAVWNVVLTGAEITELYNSGDAYDATNIQAANLILYYKYDSGPGNTTLTDSSAGGNDHVGTMTNMDGGTAEVEPTPCKYCALC